MRHRTVSLQKHGTWPPHTYRDQCLGYRACYKCWCYSWSRTAPLCRPWSPACWRRTMSRRHCWHWPGLPHSLTDLLTPTSTLRRQSCQSLSVTSLAEAQVTLQPQKTMLQSRGQLTKGALQECHSTDQCFSAVRIVFFHFWSNRIVIVGLKSHQ